MTWKCTHENCFRDTTCALGEIKRQDCPHWREENAEELPVVGETEVRPSDIPWNGYALGRSDLAVLAGRGQPLVIGLVGPPDSGKTSLLAFGYMWLLKHGALARWDFAGSWTLGGWESVVRYCRWTGLPPPAFPPHTSSTGRHPGMLHVSLRHQTTGELKDVLFTDAPGEWFTQWARTPASSTAEGARWVIGHSDVLLLLVDSALLADDEKLPQARRAARDMIERVAAQGTARPVIVVWTKDDVTVPGEVRNSIDRACGELLPHAPVRKTTFASPDTIEQCFEAALRAARESPVSCNLVESRESHDPFLAFRGLDGDP